MKAIALDVRIAMGLWMIGVSACSPDSPHGGGSTDGAATPSAVAAKASPSASAAGTAGGSVPPPLTAAGEYGENVYDYAKANDWKNAEARIALLKTEVEHLRTLLAKPGAEVTRLDGDVVVLDRAVTAKDRRAAMLAANQATRDVADMTARYEPPVPVEVTRLDYDGRELEVWAEANDAPKLQATATEIRRDWDDLRSAVEARNADQAKKFEALVGRVEKARTPAEFARLAKSVLDEVDNLEKVFQP